MIKSRLAKRSALSDLDSNKNSPLVTLVPFLKRVQDKRGEKNTSTKSQDSKR